MTIPELSKCKHIGHEYFCESVFLVKHKTSHSCESAIFFNLQPDIINDNCDFRFFCNIIPKAAVLDAGETLLLRKLNKVCYLQCTEHNNTPMPKSADDYTVISGSLMCDCQLQGGRGSYTKHLLHVPQKIRLTGTCTS